METVKPVSKQSCLLLCVVDVESVVPSSLHPLDVVQSAADFFSVNVSVFNFSTSDVLRL